MNFIVKDSIKILLFRVISFLISSINVILVGKIFGSVGEGVYSLIASSFTIIAQVAALGLDQYLIVYYNKKDEISQKIFNFIVAIHIFIITPLFYLGFLFYFKDLNIWGKFFLIFGVISNSIVNFSYFYYIMFFKVSEFIKIGILRSSLFLFFLFGFLIFDISQDYIGFFYSLSWVVIASILMYDIFKNNHIKFYFNYKKIKEVWQNVLKYSLGIFFASFFYIVMIRESLFIAHKVVGLSATGVLFVILTTAEILWYLPSAFGDILLRELSNNQDEYLIFKNYHKKIFWIMSFLAILSIIPYKIIVDYILREEFRGTTYLYIILLPSIVFLGISRFYSVFFLVKNKTYYSTISTFFSMVLNFILSYILVFKYKIEGIVISITISYMFSVLIDFIFLKRYLSYKQILKLFI